MIPGEICINGEDIDINVGQQKLKIEVENSGDRPVQVGSHYHFFEVNSALIFDRKKSYGFRLDIAAGTAIRFEPGQTRQISLTTFSGSRRVFGFRGEVSGKLEDMQ